MNKYNPVIISDITLTNFRNYIFRKFNFNSDINIIYGNNGLGKTNILEAISLLNKGKGCRSASLDTIPTINSNNFTIYSKIKNHPNINYIGTSYNSLDKKRSIKTSNKTNNGRLSIIWLIPQMNHLFISSKSERRKFLDQITSDIYPNHFTQINSYEKLVKERMLLLTRNQNSNEWITIIERKIAELGVSIAFARNDSINYLNKAMIIMKSNLTKVRLDLIGDIENKSLEEKSIDIENYFVDKLKQNRNLDKKIGRTNFGIHRSDFTTILINKNIEAKISSTGEQKSILISIIIARTKIFDLLDLSPPILLLDEALSNLDQDKIVEFFKELNHINSQCFLTGINKEIFNNTQLINNKKVLFTELISN